MRIFNWHAWVPAGITWGTGARPGHFCFLPVKNQSHVTLALKALFGYQVFSLNLWSVAPDPLILTCVALSTATKPTSSAMLAMPIKMFCLGGIVVHQNHKQKKNMNTSAKSVKVLRYISRESGLRSLCIQNQYKGRCIHCALTWAISWYVVVSCHFNKSMASKEYTFSLRGRHWCLWLSRCQFVVKLLLFCPALFYNVLYNLLSQKNQTRTSSTAVCSSSGKTWHCALQSWRVWCSVSATAFQFWKAPAATSWLPLKCLTCGAETTMNHIGFPWFPFLRSRPSSVYHCQCWCLSSNQLWITKHCRMSGGWNYRSVEAFSNLLHTSCNCLPLADHSGSRMPENSAIDPGHLLPVGQWVTAAICTMQSENKRKICKAEQCLCGLLVLNCRVRAWSASTCTCTSNIPACNSQLMK